MFGLSNTQTSFSWRSYWRTPLNLIPVVLTVLVNVAQWVISVSQFSTDQGFLVIRYSIYKGPNWLAPWYYILLLPLTGLLLLMMDFAFGYFLGKYSLLLRQLILWVGLIFNIALLWLVLLLVVINS